MGIRVVRKHGRKGWYVSVCENGERYVRFAGSKEDAYELKKKIGESLKPVAPAAPEEDKPAALEGVPFADAVARWQREHVEIKLKPSSRKYYADIVKDWLLPAFGDMTLDAMTRSELKRTVAKWKEQRENPPTPPPAPEGKRKPKKAASRNGLRSIPNVLRTLSAFFSWAVEEELVEVNPAINPSRIYKVDGPFQGDYLRPEEVAPYLEGVRKKASRYFPILRTMTFAGLRVGEAIALTWQDIDWNGKFLMVRRSSWNGHVGSPKTKSSIRRVHLSSEMLDILQQHRRDMAARALKAGRPMPDTVFVNDAGGPMDASKVRRAHDRGLKAAGLRHIRLHDTRGTFTALTVSAGVPVYHVSKSLGHSSTEVTGRHYADLAPGAAKELPNMLERFVLENSAEKNGMEFEQNANRGKI